jgi:hypothetical protein
MPGTKVQASIERPRAGDPVVERTFPIARRSWNPRIPKTSNAIPPTATDHTRIQSHQLPNVFSV